MQTVFLHGFGFTPAIWPFPVDWAPELDLSDIKRVAQQIADRLTKPITLIGWSMGGMVAMKLAALTPGKIAKLFLISTTPKFLASAGYTQGISSTLLKRLKQKIKKEGMGAFHELVFGNQTMPGFAHISFEQAERELDELARIDLRADLPKIKCPTVIIHGDKDKICPPSAANFLKEHIVGSELIILKEVGHDSLVAALKYVQ